MTPDRAPAHSPDHPPSAPFRGQNTVAQGDGLQALSQADADVLSHAQALRHRIRQDFDEERERLGLPGRVHPETSRQLGGSQVPGQSPAEVPADIAEALERQAALRDAVHAQYKVEDGRFLYKEPPYSLAFQDKGARLVAGTNDERVARAMADMAEAKGWTRLTVAGHPDFRRAVWLHASVRGLQVSGFKPTERDRQALAQRQAQALGNRIEPGRGGPRDRGKARQALRHPAALRSAELQRVIEAVASAVIDARVAGSAQRAVLKAAIDARLRDRAQEGRLPAVGLYDKQAPSLRERTIQPQRTEPANERSR